MNKKHFIGMLIVLLISGFVIWQELRKTPIKALWGASKKLNLTFLLLVLLVMVFLLKIRVDTTKIRTKTVIKINVFIIE